MIRYIDANVLVHAIIDEENKVLNPKTIRIKENSRKILERINDGKEKVFISTVQLSEALNVLESLADFSIAFRLQKIMLEHAGFNIVSVNKEDVLKAHEITAYYLENKIGFNDAIAYVSMEKKGCNEIYTFDKHFNIFKNIKRIEK